MRAAKPFIVVLCLGLFACVGDTFGDGGMFYRRSSSYKYADVFQPTQKVFIRWDGAQEKLLVQTKYEGPAEEMVWIIPVPSQPTVERADGAVFQDLSRETANLAIDYTDFVGFDIDVWSSAGGSVGGSSPNPVEWHERIGDYDVALLRPVAGEDVIQWLNANDFMTPEDIHPLLEDYTRDGWWMVAARIHPEALTPITREKLAKGTLHPLEMTFQSSACVYPMRLTRLAAGPVEELIYIEGPHHYEPATLADGSWEITIFGGPIRKVPQNYPLSDMERAVEIMEGRTRTEVKTRLTKLRRVFQPSEMTEDLIFREIDLTQWLANKDLTRLTPAPDWRGPIVWTDVARQITGSPHARIAQAATQYGRWRDPNGITPLVNALSPEVLDQVKPRPEDCQPWSLPSTKFLSSFGLYTWSYPPTRIDWPFYPTCVPLRSCIWALGEIAIEHPLNDAAEEALLHCVRHDNQVIRMEACVALAKMRSKRLGPVLIDQLTRALQTAPISTAGSYGDIQDQCAMAELDILADWLWQFGTAEQKDALVELLRESMMKTSLEASYWITERQEWTGFAYGHWPTWIMWRAACTQDPRFIPAIESRHPQCTSAEPDCLHTFQRRAEAACGSLEPTVTMIREVGEQANATVRAGQLGTVPYTSLDALYESNVGLSLRVAILWRRGFRYELYPMPLDASDRIIRSAMSGESLSEWHLLHMLARIKRPVPQDREAMMRIWDRHEEATRLLVVDVLYVWGDVQMLMDLYEQAEFGAVKAEIAWALAELEIPEAASIIEEQVHATWNPQWLSLNRTFIHPVQSLRRPGAASYLNADMRRVEETLWDYFHPISGVLDNERLAVLKRLAADGTIHAGMRFDWVGTDYGGTDWGLPLLEKAARDILAVDSSPQTVQKITSTMKSVGNSGFVISPN